MVQLVKRLVFPENLMDQQHMHWMNIQAFDQDTPRDTVSLFIPAGNQNGSLAWEHAHDYSDPKLARLAPGFLGIGAGGTGGTIVGMMGGAINPKVEVLYRNTDLRRFQFNFLFAPVSEYESRVMKDIIMLLRYHSAPDLIGESDPSQGYTGARQSSYLTSGGLFKSPSEFLIKFYYNNRENTAIPRIGRSIIERIDVNYTPLGEFSTFSNGHPVSAMLTVVFRELRLIDKSNIIDGGY